MLKNTSISKKNLKKHLKIKTDVLQLPKQDSIDRNTVIKKRMTQHLTN